MKGAMTMTENGLVIRTDGRTACVVFSRNANCTRCNACAIGRGKNMIAEVNNPIKAKKGDQVIVEINERQALKAALFAFGLPIAALVLGVLVFSSLAQRMGFGDSSGIIGGVAGGVFLLLAFVGAYRYDRHLRAQNRHRLKIVQAIRD